MRSIKLTQDGSLDAFNLIRDCVIPGRANFGGKNIGEPWVPRREVLGDQKRDFLLVSLSLRDNSEASASFTTR